MRYSYSRQSNAIFYLQLAGDCVIEIEFEPFEIRPVRQRLIKEFISLYRAFILNTIPGKTHFRIVFLNYHHARAIKKSHSSSGYIQYYERKKNTVITYYQISLLIFQLIIRDLTLEYLSHHNGILLHASAAQINDCAYLFLGKNSAGKSTLIKLLNPSYSAICDDMLALKKESHEFYVYQLPFIGKENWFNKSSRKCKVGKLFFLHKSQNVTITAEENKDAILSYMISLVLTEKDYSRKNIDLLISLIAKHAHDFHHFYFPKNRMKVLNALKTFTSSTK